MCSAKRSKAASLGHKLLSSVCAVSGNTLASGYVEIYFEWQKASVDNRRPKRNGVSLVWSTTRVVNPVRPEKI